MRSSWPNILLLSLCLLLCGTIGAQHYNYPLNKYSRLFLLRSDTVHHGSFQGQTMNRYSVDTLKGLEQRTRYSRAADKLYDDHLINIEAEDFSAHIDLLLNFEIAQEQWEDNDYHDTTSLSRNMRGFIIRADIGDKVSIATSFREFQSYVPWYLFQYSVAQGVMPGSGRVKPFNATGLDHNIAQGYVSYSPSDNINLQFGSQRNFIGSGYRSLLLSDHGYAYPQLKGSFYFFQGKLRYHLIHAWLQTLERLPQGITPESLFIRKNGGFKYLEFSPIDELSVGLFEGVMWNRFLPQEGTQDPNALMYSPVIGTAMLGLGLDDVLDNVIVGVDLSARPIDQLLLYGQYMMDREERDGFQVGIRTIDMGVDGLSLRVEYNSVAPFSYTNGNVRQGYNHFSEPLAHPMGAGFDEVNAGLMYFKKRWFADLSYTHAEQLLDQFNMEGELCSPGGYIFSTANCNVTENTDSFQAQLDQLDARVGYMFNPRSNFNTYIGWRYRERSGAGERQGHSIVSFGIEMSLFDRYEDF